MDADRQKLADRVLKLLALAAGTTFDAEAATARRLANELMAKHNLSLTEGAKDRAKLGIQFHVPHFKGAIWEFILACAAADIAGCAAYTKEDVHDRFCFCGTTADLEAALYILAKLNEQRMGGWMTYKRQGGADSFHKFCYGYAQGVLSKVHILVRPMTEVTGATKAAELWYEANITKTTGITFGRASSGAGMDAGGSASLHRGEMGGGAPQRRIR